MAGKTPSDARTGASLESKAGGVRSPQIQGILAAVHLRERRGCCRKAVIAAAPDQWEVLSASQLTDQDTGADQVGMSKPSESWVAEKALMFSHRSMETSAKETWSLRSEKLPQSARAKRSFRVWFHDFEHRDRQTRTFRTGRSTAVTHHEDPANILV